MLCAPAPSRELHIELSRDAGAVVMTLRGELDIAGLDDFAAAAASLDPWSASVVLDLRDLTFLDARGARAIGRLHTTLARSDRHLEILAGDSPARRVLELLGLGERLDFAD